MANHHGRNAKNSTYLLDAELACFEHLCILRIDRQLLIFETGFKNSNLTGLLRPGKLTKHLTELFTLFGF
ncbi:hypothetical protein D9M70_644940 [compost metagenome]